MSSVFKEIGKCHVLAKIGYIPSGYLNIRRHGAATGSMDAETGLPIATGLDRGLTC